MKKILASLISFALLFSVVGAAMLGAKVYAFTIENDAQTAMEKNQENVLAALETMEASNDITKDELQLWIMSQCEYSSDKMYGAGVMVENFRLTRATDNKAGFFTADVLIYQDDGEVGFEIRKEIPALGGVLNSGTETSDDESKNAADNESGSNEYDQTVDKPTSAEAKKNIEAASKAINAAIYDFEVSNDTTKEDVLKMAKNAISELSAVRVSLSNSDFTIVKASTTVNGTFSATLVLTCDAETKRIPIAKTIQPVITENSTKIDEDKHAISKALSNMAYSNKVTKESLLKVAESAVKNGSKISWKDNFYKKEATFDEDGIVFGYILMTLDEEKREVWVNEKIPMAIRKIPSDKLSVNKEEWEILRMVNVEREKEGRKLLTMVDQLQTACDIREKEVLEVISHTRPNGSKYYTAITDFNYTTAGENIYHCPSISTIVPAEKAMQAWMNSTEHRANILKDVYDYIGVGSYEKNRDGSAIQLFTGWANPITEITTSSGTTYFEDEEAMQKEYLICTTSDGVVSYMPLDVSYMKKSGNSYTLNMRTTNPITLTVGGEKTADTEAENSNSQKTNTVFADVKPGEYYENAVKWAVDNKITTGTSSTTFSPNDTCTRAQIITFLWRAVGSPKASSNNPFVDVKETDYYYDAAVWASEKSMVSGKIFAADTPCTRATTVIYLWQNAGAPQIKTSNKFSDVSASADCAVAVAWAIENGVTSGTSETTFSPETICTRGQIVTFLKRAIQK